LHCTNDLRGRLNQSLECHMSKRNPGLMFFSSRSGMTKLPIPSGKKRESPDK